MKFIKSVPMALSGLSLSIAALGNLLLPYGEGIRYACGILSAAILIVFALKLILDFPHAREELKTPVPLSVLPTSTMALMLLCTYIRPFLGLAATCLWYAAVLTHLFLMLLFFKRFILGFKLATVFPSWFVVFVGIVTTSVTAPAMGAALVGRAAFYIGFLLYFTAFVLIVCRMAKVKLFPEPARPTIVIFTAPMSLCIVGYFSSFERQNEILVFAMLIIAVASYVFVSVMMLSLLRIKFYPTYAAFTFPYVISATAFRIGAAFLAERGIYFFTPVAHISQWVAVAVVLYVFAHYVRFFWWWLKF
jgi:exfoliative toxin A/B